MIAYILKSSASLIILFGLYWLLLRKEKLFVFNRYFLVAAVVFSLTVPFIAIPVNFRVTPQLNEIFSSNNIVIPDVSPSDKIVTPGASINQQIIEKQAPVTIPAILLALYFAGVILFLFRFLRNIFRILRRSKLSGKIYVEGCRIVLTDEKTGPCCFFGTIFLNSDDYLNGRIEKVLLQHELEHARQHHTIDVMLIEFVKIFYWFNPIHVLYERAIRINHEYMADNGVINVNPDIKSYAEKLLSFIAGRSCMSLTSGSSHSFIKKRLLMLAKTKSGIAVYGLRITVTLSLILIFSLFISFKQTAIRPTGNDKLNKSVKTDTLLPVFERPELFPIKKDSVGYTKITRTFGEKGINPVTKEKVIHYGIDIQARFGTDVMATAGGKVINASWDDKGLGNLIEIDHGDGYQSRYAHLKDFNVKQGDMVTKGQIIGHVGSSGISTGPHLHFEIRCKGERVNPLTYLK